MRTPVVVLISDVHYNLQTLELADAAMRQAILRANSLKVPLIVAGDLTDNKANMRAEVVNRMLETFKLPNIRPYVLVGNHDKINEKSEEHALNFLGGLAELIDKPYVPTNIVCKEAFPTLVPYMSDPYAYQGAYINRSVIIMHQGITGSNSGDYLQDKSAINKQDVAGLRIVSGHYHARQTIDLADGGNWDYIGNPYTLTWGEANDPEKGFQILMSDGSLEFVPTDLRKHVIIDIHIGFNSTEYEYSSEYKPGDLLKVRLNGTKERLAGTSKELARRLLSLPPGTNFILDILPSETKTDAAHIKNDMSQPEVIDNLINTIDTTKSQKSRLKKLWRDL